MAEVSTAFNFEHIPRNIDKSSIKTFLNTKGIYSLEYAIVNPQDVFINMHAVARGWFRKKKSLKRGMATIQQFATSFGLLPDFNDYRKKIWFTTGHTTTIAELELFVDKIVLVAIKHHKKDSFTGRNPR